MYESKIAKRIKMGRFPVAVLYKEEVPKGATTLLPGRHGCVVSLLNVASKGRVAAFTEETTTCPGGKAGLGFKDLPDGLEFFLSTGSTKRKGEFYKESPDQAKAYMETLPEVQKPTCVVFKPLSKVEEYETPLAVIFLVNADQLSALVTLANFDRMDQENVRIKFGAGCVQSIRYVLSEKTEDCYIGLTDPSARKVIDKDLLSFTVPYERYLQMEEKVEKSFLAHETWERIAKRIE